MELSSYRIMWALVMFDLPVKTKRQRRSYARFRNFLMNDGFMRLQFSVYARPVGSREDLETHIGRVKRKLPPEGAVRILQFTDKQFGMMEAFFGKVPEKNPEGPRQLELF